MLSNERPHRWYARVAAVAFLLVALYTLAFKLPSGELERDWLHTVLHGSTGALAAYAGWLAAAVWPARAVTLGVTVAYGVLGVGGWFIDGLFIGTPVQIPLQAADNVFHLLLAGGGIVTLVAASGFGDLRRTR